MSVLQEKVAEYLKRLDDVQPAVGELHQKWVAARLDPFVLVDYLYLTGEYVDNEFYRLLINVRARPDLFSALHIRSYNDGLPHRIENIWENEIGKPLGFSHVTHPIYGFANGIAEDIMSTFGLAYQENPDLAYEVLRKPVEGFVNAMQSSRKLLAG